MNVGSWSWTVIYICRVAPTAAAARASCQLANHDAVLPYLWGMGQSVRLHAAAYQLELPLNFTCINCASRCFSGFFLKILEENTLWIAASYKVCVAHLSYREFVFIYFANLTYFLAGNGDCFMRASSWEQPMSIIRAVFLFDSNNDQNSQNDLCVIFTLSYNKPI